MRLEKEKLKQLLNDISALHFILVFGRKSCNFQDSIVTWLYHML